ncbi:MAG: ABC transporter ATP-binding protein [Clostridia bacterium]|nr:ABC transporter ATP-binding protein [Clostridia bacterium]
MKISYDGKKESKGRSLTRHSSGFDQEQILKQEQEFIDCYMSSGDKSSGSVKILLKLYRRHIKELIFSCLFFIIQTLPVWIIPVVVANIIDIATQKPENALTLFIINISVAMFFILQNILTTYLSVVFMSRANRSVEASLRSAIVRKLQQLSIRYHNEMQSGRIHNKIMNDVTAVEGLANQVFLSLLSIILNIVVSISVILTKSIAVVIFFVVCSITAAAVMKLFSKTIQNNIHTFRLEKEKTSAQVVDMVDMIPITKAHALEDTETNKMSRQMSMIAKSGYKLDTVNAVFSASTWVVFSVFQLICVAFSGYMAFKGKISVGDIALYQSYFASVVGSVSSLMGLLPSLTTGLEAVKSIGEVLRERDIEDNVGKISLDSLSGEYEFKDVSFSYGDGREILHGLDLKIKAGETIALVGESGAGKSTILNMAIGFIMPKSGVMTIDGKDIKQIDLKSYRKHIAVVPQTSILFSGTVRQNITYGLKNISEEQLWEVIRAAKLEEVIKNMPQGIETNVGEHGGLLSGGQRQRISIARAIIREPSVILFDEATSALDSATEQEVQQAIENLTHNRTTFIVAHRLSTIKNADKIAFIKDGRCVEFGSFDELMALKGEFYKLRTLQS